MKLRPEKNSGLNGIRATDLCDSGAGRNECNDWAFFDIFKFSLKERFRGQRQRKVDEKQIFFHIHSILFILFFVVAAWLSSWIFDISKMVYCLRRREVRRSRSECLANGIYNQNKSTSILFPFPYLLRSLFSSLLFVAKIGIIIIIRTIITIISVKS